MKRRMKLFSPANLLSKLDLQGFLRKIPAGSVFSALKIVYPV